MNSLPLSESIPQSIEGTQTRTPGPVASICARIIHENGIADDLMEQYGDFLK